MPDAYPLTVAVMGLLEPLASLSPLALPAYLGGAPSGATAPYLAVYPDAGEVEQTSLVPDQGMTQRISMHAVGAGPEQALWAMDKARGVLLGQQPSVTGRSLWRIWQEQGPQPVSRDDDVTPPVYLTYAEFGVHADPA